MHRGVLPPIAWTFNEQQMTEEICKSDHVVNMSPHSLSERKKDIALVPYLPVWKPIFGIDHQKGESPIVLKEVR